MRRRAAGPGAREHLRREAVAFAQQYADLDPRLWDEVDRLDRGHPVRCHGWEIGLDPRFDYLVTGDDRVEAVATTTPLGES